MTLPERLARQGWLCAFALACAGSVVFPARPAAGAAAPLPVTQFKVDS
jgi:hypothetical protein